MSYAQLRYVHSVRSFRTGLPGPAPVRVALSGRPRTAALATPSVCETAFSRTAVGTRKRNFQYRVRVRETAPAVHESVTPTPNDRAEVRPPVAPASAIRTAYANRARSADAIDCGHEWARVTGGPVAGRIGHGGRRVSRTSDGRPVKLIFLKSVGGRDKNINCSLYGGFGTEKRQVRHVDDTITMDDLSIRQLH